MKEEKGNKARSDINAPICSLEKGESIFVSGKKSRTVFSYVQYMKRKLQKKFTCRSVKENGIDGVKIWRTE